MTAKRGAQDKTIKKHLAKVVTNWIHSINDKGVRDLARRDTVVAGGAIASLMMGDEVNDYDLYFKTKETALAVADYYIDVAKSQGLNISPDAKAVIANATNIRGELEERVVVYMPGRPGAVKDHEPVEDPLFDSEQKCTPASPGEPECTTSPSDSLPPDDESNEKEHKVRFISENAITLNRKIQIVTRFQGSAEEIFRNFDYIHAMCAYDYGKHCLTYSPEAIRSMQSRRLKYSGSLYPLCSMYRMRKFMARGWTISASEITKMALQLNDANLRDIDVLREQVTGVDQVYFFQFLAKLEEEMTSNKELEMTRVCEILDEAFGE